MHAVVIGITSQLGLPMARSLAALGYAVHGYSRSTLQFESVEMHAWPGTGTNASARPARADVIITFAPLTIIGQVLDLARILNCRRVLAFGTTGIFTKGDSTSSVERQQVQDQLRAERYLRENAPLHGISWTLFRPTMIYGVNADQNVAFIRSVFRALHCFPIPVGARGVRQPVHVEDLVQSCCDVIHNTSTHNKAYNLSGGEVLHYEDMVRRIALADGLNPRLVPIPLTLYRFLISLARLLPRFSHLRKEMVDRMYFDLVADHSEASTDFGFKPREFTPPSVSCHTSVEPPPIPGQARTC
jgi:nucleoside-diphosphate-sugar epimerase